MGLASGRTELPGQVLGSVSGNLRPEQSLPFGENSRSPLVSLWHGEGLAARGCHPGSRAQESGVGQTLSLPPLSPEDKLGAAPSAVWGLALRLVQGP